jgi:hypothetical protein
MTRALRLALPLSLSLVALCVGDKPPCSIGQQVLTREAERFTTRDMMQT